MKVLLIDDHPLILSAMQSVILQIDHGIEAVTVESAAECRTVLAKRRDFDLILLDLQLGDADGFELLAELRREHPALPVSASEHPGDALRAIDAGAMGFVPKRSSNELLQDAVHLVMSGGIYMPELVPTDRAEPSPVPPLAAPSGVAAAAQASRPGVRARAGGSLADLGLTPRQRQVMQLLLHGKSNKLIARDLGISVETVKDHVAAVLRSLGVTSRTQAVLAVGLMSDLSEGSLS
ncbi:two component transcriptional regulator, LuxR family [Sphaerotilus natans]|uniref:response regulator n=2 Tax=Sphaerotilus natans TaxID=34103 RepID=UPI000956827B|nr:response regulator transcription factor [Sphaerotilus natans]SIQ91709.1 two component transcriptional regulator, LuxR family [Sphaerotilus natans]